jgi:hypothetical protein
MILPTKIESQLTNFIKPKIVFIAENKQYQFNKKWLTNINENTFNESLLTLLLDLNEHLKAGKNNQDFLKSLINILDAETNWFYEQQILKTDNFEGFLSTIKTIISTDEGAPPKEKYSIDFILKCNKNTILEVNSEDNYYYKIWELRNEYNNYIEAIDFEKVKLRYVMQLHYNSLLKAFHYIDALLLDYDKINFSEFNYNGLLESYDLIEPSKKEVSHQKCHVNLNKKETAQLFVFLMRTGFFSFDEDERKNRALLTKFIESHFTYNGENETKSVIKNMNQEFTPLFHPNEKNQLPFITKLIDILEIRKSNLE